MKLNENIIHLTSALALAGLLVGCENATLSTAGAPEQWSPISDARAAAIAPDVAHDALLAARLADRLQSDPATSEVAIYVSVSEGRARLSGFVDNAAAKLRAGALAAETAGIEAVENRLIVRNRAGVKNDPLGDARVYL